MDGKPALNAASGPAGWKRLPLASLVVLDSGYLATHTPFPGVQCRYTCMHTSAYGVHMSVGPPFAQM